MIERHQAQAIGGRDGSNLAISKRRRTTDLRQPRPLLGMPLGRLLIIRQHRDGSCDDIVEVGLDHRAFG